MPSKSAKVQLVRDGNAIIALIGPDLQTGIAGSGNTAPEALRDLANAIEREKRPLPELEPEQPKPVRVKSAHLLSSARRNVGSPPAFTST
jgi:hypothetical protein